MSCYTDMAKTELMIKVMELGVNPYTMTQTQMIQFLEGTDKAQQMSDEELLRHIQNRG